MPISYLIVIHLNQEFAHLDPLTHGWKLEHDDMMVLKFQLNVKDVGHNLGVYVHPLTHVPQELQIFHLDDDDDDEQSELAEETILSSVSSDEDE